MSGRYNIIGTLASGGMGTVYLARMIGSAGFSRFVAIKRLHPHHATQPQLVAMLVDEARVAVQIRHANVIDTLDLVATEGVFGLVLEYVEGAALSTLIENAKALGEDVPRPIAMALIRGMLRGLDAAHEARNPDGEPLDMVHRDVSPQNVLVGIDGIPRLIDFGIAKAMGRLAASTQTGEVRGKFAYMAPEQLLEQPVTRQTDVYAAGVMLFQLLTGKLPFESDDSRVVMAKVMTESVPAPSTRKSDIGPELDAVVLGATAREVADRYATAQQLNDALSSEPAASNDDVGAWVRRLAAEQLAKQGELRLAVPADASRSIEDLLVELSAPPPAPPPPPPVAIAAAAPPPVEKKRTWILLPIAAAIGLAGVVAGLRATPDKPAVAETTATFPPPPPLPTTTAALEIEEEAPSASPAVPPRRPIHRKKTPGTPSAGTAPVRDPDKDHR